jgi:hypothetical protein
MIRFKSGKPTNHCSVGDLDVENTCSWRDPRLQPRLGRAASVDRGLRKPVGITFGERQDATKRRGYDQATPRVTAGPFAGRLCLDEVVWGPIEPKRFWTFEAELHDVIKLTIGTTGAIVWRRLLRWALRREPVEFRTRAWEPGASVLASLAC